MEICFQLVRDVRFLMFFCEAQPALPRGDEGRSESRTGGGVVMGGTEADTALLQLWFS